MSGKNDSLSFADAYGLGLIARNPSGVNLAEIVQNLSPKAQPIGRALMDGPAIRVTKPSSKASSKRAKKK